MEKKVHAPKKKYLHSMRLSQDSINEIGSPGSISDAPSPLSLPSVKMEDLRSPDSQFSLDFNIKSPLSVKSKLEFGDMLDLNIRSPPSVSQNDPLSPIPSPQVLNTPLMPAVVHSPRSGTRILNGDGVRDDQEIKVPPKKLKTLKGSHTPERRSSLRDSIDSLRFESSARNGDDRESGYRSDSPRSSLADTSRNPLSAGSTSDTLSPDTSSNPPPKPSDSSPSAGTVTSHGAVQLPNIDSNQETQVNTVTQSVEPTSSPDNVSRLSYSKMQPSSTAQVSSQISPQLPSSTSTVPRSVGLLGGGIEKVTTESLYPHLRFNDSKIRAPSPMMANYQGNLLNAPPLQRLSPADLQHLTQSDYDLHMFLQQEGGLLHHPYSGAPLVPFARPPGIMTSPSITLPQAMGHNGASPSALSPPNGNLRPLDGVGRGMISNAAIPGSTQGLQLSPSEHYTSPQHSRNFDMLKVPAIARSQEPRMPYLSDSGMSKGDYPHRSPHDGLDLMGSKNHTSDGAMLSPNYADSLNSPMESTHRSFTAQLLPDSGYASQPWVTGNKLSGMIEAQSNSLRKDSVSSGTYPFLPQGPDPLGQRRDYPLLPGTSGMHPGYPGHTLDMRDLKSSDMAGSPNSCSSTHCFAQLDSTRCQVCNDNASGFHCGAYVCEACKKFFIRCQKNDSKTLLCPKNKDCIITKETRTQCQYCRYQKCLKIGMYKPGPGQNADISPDISGIPCKVCGAPSSGYHFGAITCEGCKGFFRRTTKELMKYLNICGFFRRTVKERDSYSYQCVKDGNCIINMATRNMCKYCRYKKCLEAGMTPEGSRIGRQPNAVKHATMLQLQELQKTNSIARKPPSVKDDEDDIKPLLSELPPAPVEVPEEYREMARTLTDALHNLDTINKRAPKVTYNLTPHSTFVNIWNAMMEQFGVCAHATLMFAKKVPGFRNLPIEDQIALVQNAVYQIVLTILSLDYDEVTGDYNYFNFTHEEERCIMNLFPEFEILPKQFIYFGQTFKKMLMDKTEIAHFCALILLCLEQVKSHKELVALQEKIFVSLQYYCQDKYGTETCRHGELLARLVELRRANIQHHQAVFQLKTTHSNLEIPQLYTEMFLND